MKRTVELFEAGLTGLKGTWTGLTGFTGFKKTGCVKSGPTGLAFMASLYGRGGDFPVIS
jgi:hypothetical protein